MEADTLNSTQTPSSNNTSEQTSEPKNSSKNSNDEYSDSNTNTLPNKSDLNNSQINNSSNKNPNSLSKQDNHHENQKLDIDNSIENDDNIRKEPSNVHKRTFKINKKLNSGNSPKPENNKSSIIYCAILTVLKAIDICPKNVSNDKIIDTNKLNDEHFEWSKIKDKIQEYIDQCCALFGFNIKDEGSRFYITQMDSKKDKCVAVFFVKKEGNEDDYLFINYQQSSIWNLIKIKFEDDHLSHSVDKYDPMKIPDDYVGIYFNSNW